MVTTTPSQTTAGNIRTTRRPLDTTPTTTETAKKYRLEAAKQHTEATRCHPYHRPAGGLSKMRWERKDRRKKFELSEKAFEAFELLKTSMATAPVLVTPDFKKPFTIQCDPSTTGVGGVLFQADDEGGEHPIAYMSAKLNKAQPNYSITELR